MPTRSYPEPRGLLITGTDTDVGKTFVGCLIARHWRAEGRRVGVYKPVASGCEPNPHGTLISHDATQLWEAAGRPGTLHDVCPQRFAAPLAPHLAAQGTLDRALLRTGLEVWRDACDFVVIEGAGGLLCPLSDGNDYVADLACELGYPLVIVAHNALGTLNHTLLTVEAATRRGLPLAAIVLNPHAARPDDRSVDSNLRELRSRVPGPVICELSADGLRFVPHVDWASLAQPAQPRS